MSPVPSRGMMCVNCSQESAEGDFVSVEFMTFVAHWGIIAFSSLLPFYL